MARKYKVCVKEVKATSFSVLAENFTRYKDAWLALSNHVREYPDIFYKISNSSDSNEIIIIGARESKEKIEPFIEQFGNIIRTEDVYVALLNTCCEYTEESEEDYTDVEYVIGEVD